jgi:hypothetical protein
MFVSSNLRQKGGEGKDRKMQREKGREKVPLGFGNKFLCECSKWQG